MGRGTSYRERLKFETLSVEAKSLKALLARELWREFGLSRLEAEVLALRSKIWLQEMIGEALPGQILISVPATNCKCYARQKRLKAKITAVDISADGEIWREYGLEVMQRSRAVRVIYEIWRQGGWASFAEIAALLNLTPNALSERIKPLKEAGVWIPQLGAKAPLDNNSFLDSVLIEKFLKGESSEKTRKIFGLTIGGFEVLLRRAVTVYRLNKEVSDIAKISELVGLREEEVESIVEIVERYCRRKSWRDLVFSYKSKGSYIKVKKGSMEVVDIVQKEHGMSIIAARIYMRRLREIADRLNKGGKKGEGETVFFAISADEGARAKLEEAKVVPVRLKYFTEEDLKLGPSGFHKTRVSDLKFARIVRYTAEARQQGGLLTLPDLAMLMGIGVDAIRGLIKANPKIVVPTRGVVKDIGRAITHKREIVELYLQMHTETEILDRTGHSYESIEAYLKEFARVLTLADRGLNAVMIRRVTGKSMPLVKAYLDLYKKYDNQPDYIFRIEQLRRVFARDEIETEDELKKKDKSFLSLQEETCDE